MPVRGLLLDSGDTVIGPRGGRWNPRFDFEERLLACWPDAPVERFEDAIAAGNAFMDSYGGTPPYVAYYRTILDALGAPHEWSDDDLLAELLPPRAPHEVVDVFSDAKALVEELTARGVPIAIVSDSWATLETTYERLGLHRYFKGFVISEVLGCCKPDARMYEAGRQVLGLRPDECLFVDDWPAHVEAAVALGYHGRIIDRAGTAAAHDLAIPSLVDLLDLF